MAVGRTGVGYDVLEEDPGLVAEQLGAREAVEDEEGFDGFGAQEVARVADCGVALWERGEGREW